MTVLHVKAKNNLAKGSDQEQVSSFLSLVGVTKEKGREPGGVWKKYCVTRHAKQRCDRATVSFQKSNIKLAKQLSDIVIYCKSVHFNGFEHAKDSHAFYEMSSFKESKAFNLAETSGKQLTSLTNTFYLMGTKKVAKSVEALL